MQIESVKTVTPELVEAFARLLPQHNPRARHPTAEQVAAVITPATNTLLIARDEQGKIVGTLTLILILAPGATFGFVEDVVVDEAARGQGIGEALVRECQRLALEQGASRVELHSGNHRQPAIRLYQRVGFKKIETNVLRFVPEQAPPSQANLHASENRLGGPC
jgi:ribosomal protein S18 acetylase RimI-like enzyme